MRVSLASLCLLGIAACRSGANPAAPGPSADDPPAVAAAMATGEASASDPASDSAPPDVDPEPEGVPGGGPDPLTLTGDVSTSIGGPTAGSLLGGVPLPLHGPGYRFSPNKDPQSRFGTVELVAALVRAAAVVHDEMPGNDLTVGDLGRPEGGDIPGHASHRAGRDVDVYFYLHDEKGEPFPAKAIPLDPDGKGTDYLDLVDPDDDIDVEIDLPRTWRFIQALLQRDGPEVQRIFVVEHVRSMLLAEAKRQKAPREIRQRFGEVTCQPRAPHDDHFHIRFFCTPEDIAAGCEDGRPIYPWHQARLAEAGTRAVLAKPARKKRRKSGVVSRAQAREDAGQMHEDVRAFLERREAWARKPHPGRPYCK